MMWPGKTLTTQVNVCIFLLKKFSQFFLDEKKTDPKKKAKSISPNRKYRRKITQAELNKTNRLESIEDDSGFKSANSWVFSPSFIDDWHKLVDYCEIVIYGVLFLGHKVWLGHYNFKSRAGTDWMVKACQRRKREWEGVEDLFCFYPFYQIQN